MLINSSCLTVNTAFTFYNRTSNLAVINCVRQLLIYSTNLTFLDMYHQGTTNSFFDIVSIISGFTIIIL